MNNEAPESSPAATAPDASTASAAPHATTTAPTARPLSSSAKAALLTSACAMIALCYAFSLVAITVLIAVLLGELVIFVALLRFGMSGIITGAMERHAGLINLFGRSLWLRKSKGGRVPLAREDAPRLFAVLDSLAQRLGINVPQEVLVEMSFNAWVELRGFRQGAKTTRLGVGYDLLAGLNENEVGAVLAHEMVHARLVRRGISTWLKGGIQRAGTLSAQLSAQQEVYRLAEKTFFGGAVCLFFADACTRAAARLVAAYSRQDEFEADIGAAELCGSAVMRAALEKLDDVSARTSRLSWHERVAKLQTGQGYAAWLLAEIANPTNASAGPAEPAATDPYATHPSIPDRLAALPPTSEIAPPSPPAISFITNPEELADRVIKELESTGARNEAEDGKHLRKTAKKIRTGASLQTGQSLMLLGTGVTLVILWLFVGIVGGNAMINVLLSAVILAAGIWAFRFFSFKKPIGIPIPSYDKIIKSAQDFRERQDIAEADKLILTRQQGAAANIAHKKTLALHHTENALKALADCDYLEAHVASRLGIEANGKSVACALVHSIAASAFRQQDVVFANFRFVRSTTGIRTFDTLWGTTWGLFLIADWASAEALLVDLIKLRPEEVTFHLLRCHAAACRGKQQTALAHARKAVELAPADFKANDVLLDTLVNNGYVREAAERVAALPTEILEHRDIRITRVRIEMLRGDFDAVHALETPILAEQSTDAETRLMLASSHEGVRRHDRAWALYEEVTQLGHYPQALVGLGRISKHRGHHDLAKRQLLSALNTKATLAPKAAPSLQFFGVVMHELSTLRSADGTCKAWIITFAKTAASGVLAGESFVIFSRGEQEAFAEMKLIVDAIIPENEIGLNHVSLRLAPKDRQPIGAVIPGVKDIWR